MFARTQDQLTRDAASLKGLTSFVWCTTVVGAGGLALGYIQAQASTVGSSKRFAHQGPAFGLGASKPIALVDGLANRLGNPEDRP
jgi:hypothetical protein